MSAVCTRYVRVLGAFYLRLVGTPADIYQYLEPLYNDYRKIKLRLTQGTEYERAACSRLSVQYCNGCICNECTCNGCAHLSTVHHDVNISESRNMCVSFLRSTWSTHYFFLAASVHMARHGSLCRLHTCLLSIIRSVGAW